MRAAPLSFFLDSERRRVTVERFVMSSRITHHSDEAYAGALAVRRRTATLRLQ